MPRSKHILVVDDDDYVREVVAEFLLCLDYQVSLAKNGKELRAFLDSSDPVDLTNLLSAARGSVAVQALSSTTACGKGWSLGRLMPDFAHKARQCRRLAADITDSDAAKAG